MELVAFGDFFHRISTHIADRLAEDILTSQAARIPC